MLSITLELLRGKKVGVSHWTSADLFTDIINAMRRVASLHGIEVSPILNAHGDIANQVAQAEVFLSQGVDAFLILGVSPDWDDLVRRAVTEGIYVFTYSPGPTTGATMNIFKRPGGGAAVGQAAAKWISRKHRGKAEFALLTSKMAPSLQDRGDAIRDAVLRHTPNAQLVSEVEAPSASAGAEAVASLLYTRA